MYNYMMGQENGPQTAVDRFQPPMFPMGDTRSPWDKLIAWGKNGGFKSALTGAGIGGLTGSVTGNGSGASMVGGSLGGAAGSAAGTALATGVLAATPLAPIAPFLGSAIGGAAGGLLGGLFGDDPEEEAKKERERQMRDTQMQALSQNMRSVADMVSGGTQNRIRQLTGGY